LEKKKEREVGINLGGWEFYPDTWQYNKKGGGGVRKSIAGDAECRLSVWRESAREDKSATVFVLERWGERGRKSERYVFRNQGGIKRRRHGSTVQVRRKKKKNFKRKKQS